MIGKNLKQIFDDIDEASPDSRINASKYSVYISIAQRLKNLRESKSLSQRALAKLAHTTQANINRWETPGCTAYTISKLVELAEALKSELFIDIRPFDRAHTITNNWDNKIILERELVNFEIKMKGEKHDSAYMVGTF